MAWGERKRLGIHSEVVVLACVGLVKAGHAQTDVPKRAEHSQNPVQYLNSLKDGVELHQATVTAIQAKGLALATR